ncbi:MAG: diguanylate cyclase, partial [bacterium]
SRETIVIPEATKDDRFKDNPLVTGEMNIRSYAGAPLITDDEYVLGTFCLIDREPRDYSSTEIDQLETLAEETMSQLELRRSRKLLEEQHQKINLQERAMEATREGITITDPNQEDNPIIYANKGFERITGHNREQVIGKNCRMLQGPDTDENKVNALREAIENAESITLRIKNYRKDGEPFWNELSVNPVFDEDGNLTHFVGIQKDVTELKEMEEQLRYQAKFDELTGLLNRGEFIDQFEHEFERAHRYDHQGCLIMIDLDHFKEINDQYGHVAGDTVLSTIGNILNETKRSNDLGGRLGGEEFCLYLPETNLDEGKNVADRILSSIRSETFSEDGSEFQVTASLGLTGLNKNDSTVSDVLKRADDAMYESKQKGRDQLTIDSE